MHALATTEERDSMEAKMKEIAAAHSCLSDPIKRRNYDRRLHVDADYSDSSDDDTGFQFDLDDYFLFVFGELLRNRRHRFRHGAQTGYFWF